MACMRVAAAAMECRRARGGKKNLARSGTGLCKIRIIYAGLNAPIVDKAEPLDYLIYEGLVVSYFGCCRSVVFM
jgi:hypothetical protein